MNVDEVCRFLTGPSPLLMFDTNAIFSSNPRTDPFAALCVEVKQRNEEAPGERRITLAISSLVFVEKLHDMRSQYGERFNPALIETFLVNQSIEVLPFESGVASETAALIAKAHPSRESWRAFKKRRCLECLGLPQGFAAQGSGQGCGATVDWFVAGHALTLRALLVTNDTGPEFASISLKTSLANVASAIASLRG